MCSIRVERPAHRFGGAVSESAEWLRSTQPHSNIHPSRRHPWWSGPFLRDLAAQVPSVERPAHRYFEHALDVSKREIIQITVGNHGGGLHVREPGATTPGFPALHGVDSRAVRRHGMVCTPYGIDHSLPSKCPRFVYNVRGVHIDTHLCIFHPRPEYHDTDLPFPSSYCWTEPSKIHRFELQPGDRHRKPCERIQQTPHEARCCLLPIHKIRNRRHQVKVIHSPGVGFVAGIQSLLKIR